MQFHENLKRICSEHGTSPTAVLIEMGIATSKLAAWNRGMLPKQDMMERIAQHLHCQVSDFFWNGEGDAPKVVTQVVKTIPEDPDEEDILNIFRSLNRRDRHAFMADVYKYQSDNQ